jgi:hypothetical protein
LFFRRFDGNRGGRGGGRPQRGSSGGPMRSGPPFGGRSGQNSNRGDPYPSPPPPSYVRERMSNSGNQGFNNPMFGGGQSSGGQIYQQPTPGGPMNRGGSVSASYDPYSRGASSQKHMPDPFDRRQAGPSPFGGALQMGGGRDVGGPGPMRGPDQYGQSSFVGSS